MTIVSKWMRTCQECGNCQEAKMPIQNKELTQAFIDVKCKKCKSQSMDYGRNVEYDEFGVKVVQKDDEGEDEL